MQAQRVPRAERHRQVAALKSEGLTFKQIADRLKVSFTTVTAAYYDPDGSKDLARKQRRSGTCKDCGRTVHNSGSEPPERCLICHQAYVKTPESRHTRAFGSVVKWTDRQMLDAVREHESTTEYARVRALNPATMPSLPAITKRFGTWNAARAAAGARVVAPRKPYRNRLTREGALLAIEDCIAAIGREPSATEYDAWAKEVGAPTSQVIRLRCGPWLDATALAAERLSG